MDSRSPVLAVWRDLWLEPSQTFIRDQLSAMSRWQPVRVGLQERRISILAPQLAAVPRWLPRRLMWPLTTAGKPLPGLLQRLREARTELVHAHFGPDAIHALPYARALGVPLIVTFHGYDVTQLPADPSTGQEYLASLESVFDYASYLVAVSDFIGRHLLAMGAPAAKVVVRKIGLPLIELEDPPVAREGIVFVGRLVPKKGVADLLNAVALLPGALRDTPVTIVGYGPLAQPLADLAARLELRATFPGHRSTAEIAAILRAHAVFCAPSKTSQSGDAEGFGIVFLEAAAQATPVVSYRHGGVPEAVLDGVTGVLVTEGDVPGLARALERLLSDPGYATTLGQAGRARAVSEFDIRRCTADLEDLYDIAVREYRQRST